MNNVRLCRNEELSVILGIINSAAERYRGVIPVDRWKEPYMSLEELSREISAGVSFFGVESHGNLVGIMGHQGVKDVELIRHAYVKPHWQHQGIGSVLLREVCRNRERRMLVGTWAAASWAIAFYQRHGFTRVPSEIAKSLLKTYWSVPDRQIETSVVLEREVVENLERESPSSTPDVQSKENG